MPLSREKSEKIENQGIPSAVIRSKLLEGGILVKEIAEQLGINRPFVSFVISGHKKSRRVASHIESLLGVSTGSLFPYLKDNTGQNQCPSNNIERS